MGTPEDFIIARYQNLLGAKPDSIGVETVVPQFCPEILYELCHRTKTILSKQPTVLRPITPPCVIVGDLHGNLIDLVRIFQRCGPASSTSYLFLGDYVDRGQFSLETITLLFALLIKYPDNIKLIRGNHEFRHINSEYGFFNDIAQLYRQSHVFQEFNFTFDYLPLAAVVGNDIFCVHGGISKYAFTVDDIDKIARPFSDDYDLIVQDLVWSDPDKFAEEYVCSHRGRGNNFGPKALSLFFAQSGMKQLIRAHECVIDGVESRFENVITVFSSSSYDPVIANNAAVLVINANMSISSHTFMPNRRYIVRHRAKFQYHTDENHEITTPPSVRSYFVPSSRSAHGQLQMSSLKTTKIGRSAIQVPQVGQKLQTRRIFSLSQFKNL